jgi:hypothetical protein
MPIASTAHISCSAPLASRRNAERELRPDLGHTRASSRHVPRANQQERSTAAGIFFSVQHTGRNGSVWSLPMLQAGCSRSRPVESSNSRRRAWPSRRFGGPRFAGLSIDAISRCEDGLAADGCQRFGGVTAAQIGMTDVLIQCVGEVIGVANSRTADVSKKIAVDEVYHFTVWYPVTLQFGPRQLDRSQAQHSLTAVRPAD